MFYEMSHTFLLILAKKGGTIKNTIYQINKGLSDRWRLKGANFIKTHKTDSHVVVAAKKAAIITTYAIHSPLHVFFQDDIFHFDPMDHERTYNEK